MAEHFEQHCGDLRPARRGLAWQLRAEQHCDPSDHLQESPGPVQARNPKKRLKKKVSFLVFLGFCKETPRKYPKKPKNTQIIKWTFGVFFFRFSGIFGDFVTDPQKHFLRLFYFIGDSC